MPDGWQARLALRVERRHGRSVLVRRLHQGPLLVQRPFHPEGEPCHVYVLHPPGGVVGGDRLNLEVETGTGAHALLTMPGAARFLRSGGRTATLVQRFRLEPGSTLEWLPQENLFFCGADVRMETRFELAQGARLLAWESHGFGRPALAGGFDAGTVQARLQLLHDGRPQLIETLRLSAGDLRVLGGRRLCATMLVFPADDAVLASVRAQLEGFAGMAGATRLDALLVLRLLADDNQAVQACLHRCWAAVRPAVLGRAACAPRIWAT